MRIEQKAGYAKCNCSKIIDDHWTRRKSFAIAIQGMPSRCWMKLDASMVEFLGVSVSAASQKMVEFVYFMFVTHSNGVEKTYNQVNSG